MRISVPQEIKNARQIEAEREARLGAAQEQVEAMIQAAGEKAETLTAEHAIRSKAQAQAEEIIAKAIEEASEIRSDADAYALEVLQRLAVQLEGFGRTVQNGIRHLQVGGRVEPGAGDAGVPVPVVVPNDRVDHSTRQG